MKPISFDVPEFRMDVLKDVAFERIKQEQLRVAGKFSHTCASQQLKDGQKLAVLVEEVGEVAKAINESSGSDSLRNELIQVAAVAIAWVESIDQARKEAGR